MHAGPHVDQMPDDPDPASGPPNAALEHVAHPELAPDLLHVDRPPPVSEARIACDHEQPAHPRQRRDDLLDDAVREILLLGIAAQVLERQHRDRGPVRQRQRRRLRDRRLRGRCCVPPPPDLLLQPRRLRLWPHAELAMQPIPQSGIELQRLRRLAALAQVPHQRAARVLAQRVERQQPPRRVRRPIPRPAGEQTGEQPRRPVLDQPPQPLALDDEPLLEGRVPHPDPVQQVAAIQRERPLARLHGPRRQQILERRHVDTGRRSVEPDRLPVGDDGGGTLRPERLAQPRQRMLQAVPCPGVVAVAPQQPREPVPGMRRARRQGEHCQQRALLLPRQVPDRAVRRPDLELAEQRHRQGSHPVLPARRPLLED